MQEGNVKLLSRAYKRLIKSELISKGRRKIAAIRRRVAPITLQSSSQGKEEKEVERLRQEEEQKRNRQERKFT